VSMTLIGPPLNECSPLLPSRALGRRHGMRTIPLSRLLLVCRIAVMAEDVLVVFGVITVSRMRHETASPQRLLTSVTTICHNDP